MRSRPQTCDRFAVSHAPSFSCFLAVLLLLAATTACSDVAVKDSAGGAAADVAIDSGEADAAGEDGAGVATDAATDAARNGGDSGADAGDPADSSPPDVTSSVPQPPTLCDPCDANTDCVAVTGKKSTCNDHGALGFYCGAGCSTDADCRSDFRCGSVDDVNGNEVSQCVPKGAAADDIGECFCGEKAAESGLETTCYAELIDGGKVLGTCSGKRACSATGLSACDADVPTKEVCDGTDNDCSGTPDDNVCDDGQPCTTDSCGKDQQCVNKATNGGCDDGDPCTVGDSCGTGTCKGGVNQCDDANGCTTDSCVAGEGCKHTKIDNCSKCAADKDCDDGAGCTVDKCVSFTQSCTNLPLVCDDGDACTTDACDAATGDCKASPKAACSVVQPLPFSANFGCGSKANSLWTIQNAATGPGWNVDGNPAPPGAKSPACSLNFNNGTDFQCPAGASNVSGTVTSPWFDATTLHPKANVRATLQLGGTWESSNKDELRIEYTVDGKQWNLMYDGNPSNSATTWQTRNLGLSAIKGKLFRLRFRFFTTDCDANTGTGPFIDDLKIYDIACHQNADCSSGNPCVISACVNHNCNNQNLCNDGDSCTQDSCAGGKCTFKPINDGKTCVDSEACGADKKCTAGACLATKPDADGAPCNDGKQCTIADVCNGGICKGAGFCDDGNPCTADSCWTKVGQCIFEPIESKCDDSSVCTTNDACQLGVCTGKHKDCDDNDVCTTDTCNPVSGDCSNKGALCDDGDSCTTDACDKATGACSHKGVSSCGATVSVPYQQPFECGSASVKSWTFTGPGVAKSGPKWNVDGDPAPPGSNSGTCSLNFNDGKTYACPSGEKLVSGEAESPWIDATNVKSAQLRLEFRLSGKWENNNNDELRLEISEDGTKWTNLYDTSNTNVNYWYLRTLSIGAYKGKKFKVRFRFFTNNCDANADVGPFIDDLRIWDSGCTVAADCDNGNLCTKWTCGSNGSCGGQGTSCKDDNPCTYDQCDPTSGKCVFPFANDGNGCSDDDACTNPDRCQGGKCHGAPFVCNDGTACTKDSCDKAVGCVFEPVCSDTDPCTVDTCNATTQKCSFPASAAGAGCDDGSVCTALETCKTGKCEGAAAAVSVLFPTSMPNPTGITTDGKGVTYVSGLSEDQVFKVVKGKREAFAGSTVGFAEGAADKAKFSNPNGLAWDAGSVFVADTNNHRIRRISGGQVSTYAGNAAGFAEGKGPTARFNAPYDVAADANGVLYVADASNGRIRRIAKDGTVTTHSGAGGGFLDGPKTTARFNQPRGLALAPDGVVFVADAYNHRIRRVAPDGSVTTLAGSQQGFVDGLGGGARFYRPHGVTMGEPGYLYVADTYNNRIRKVALSGKTTTIVGSAGAGFTNGPLGVARIYRPWHIQFAPGPDGGLAFTDYVNARVRKITGISGDPCNDGNVCTTDACDPKTGKCDNGLTAKCDDKDPCTLDGCKPADGSCTHAPNPCDDGDSCTVGACKKSDGSCSYSDVGTCNTIAKVGYAQSFQCGSKSSATWTLTGEGGPKWAVDDSPALPKPQSPKCALNFNNGKDYACAAGATKVSGTATSPWLDATGISASGGLRVSFRYGGRWETSNDDELYFEITTDEKTWTKHADLGWTSVTNYGTWTAHLNQYAGQKFKLRFRFETKDCEDNAWPGPFIDDVVIRDLSCASVKDCSDGTECTQDYCSNGRCSWGGVNCNDYDACTSDSCSPEFGCINKPVADGGGCNDSDSCTSSDTCNGGKCTGAPTGKDGATCSDGKSCTAGDKCAKGKCVGIFACDDGNPCSTDACQANGQCEWKANTNLCDDGNACTVDKCAVAPSGNCHHSAKCDDGDVCTTDSCDAKSGECSAKAIAGCVNKVPHANDFACDAGANGWVFASKHSGGPQWAVDKSPAIPAAETGGCTLNFNDGGGYKCPAGAQKVEATAESPWLDATDLPTYHAQLYMDFRIRGTWHPADAKATVYVEASKNGTAWTNRRTMNYNLSSWSNQNISLSGYAGGKFKVRFRFISEGCGATTGTGPFVDRIRLYDRRCFADEDCTQNNACSVGKCVNFSCQYAGQPCVDADACTTQTCHGEWGCRFPPMGEGSYCAPNIGCTPKRCRALKCVSEALPEGSNCNDGDTCTAGDKCSGGKCLGNASLKDGDPCTDSNACTSADTCSSGKCGGLKGHVEDSGKGWSAPAGIVVRSDGSVVVANTNLHRLRVLKGGAWTDLAGSSYNFKDGKGSVAAFRYPGGLALGAQDEVYVADRANHRIRKVTKDGTVTTVAGSGKAGITDGKSTTAEFNSPTDVAVAGAVVYVADTQNDRVRKIAADGAVSTLAGSTAGFADGKGAAVKFNRPAGIAVDGAGVVWVADTNNHRIRKITADGTVTTVAGTGYGATDGVGTAARFGYPAGITFDSAGLLYIADKNNHRVRRMDALARVITLSGTRGYGKATGALSNAQFAYPSAVAPDSNGAVWVADTNNQWVRKITWDIGNVCDDATLCTLDSCDVVSGACDNSKLNCDDGNACTQDACGANDGKCATAAYACDDGNPCTADACGKSGCVHNPTAGCKVCATSADCGDSKPCTKDVCDPAKGCQNTAISGCSSCKTGADCEDGDPCTRDVCSASGACSSTKVGDGGFCTDGSICTAVDVCVGGKCVGQSLQLQTLAGSGEAGNTNQTGLLAKFNTPTDLAVDGKGNTLVVDTGNKRLRWVNAWGYTNSAGNFVQPTGVGFSKDGWVYVADRGQHRIFRQKWGFASNPTLYAGTGGQGNKNGALNQSSFKGPTDVAAGLHKTTGTHTAWVTDTGNNVIRQLTDAGSSLLTIGTANHVLSAPTYLDYDGTNLYVVESGKKRIVRVAVSATNAVVPLTTTTPANPTSLAASPAGLWLTDSSAHTVSLLQAPASAGPFVISVIAGKKAGWLDGPAHLGLFNAPFGLAVTSDGSVVVGDEGNHRVRILRAVANLCGDGAVCAGDYCDAGTGECAFGTAKSTACDDGDAKTVDFCHSTLAKCVHQTTAN